jgi:hypothetical protein
LKIQFNPFSQNNNMKSFLKPSLLILLMSYFYVFSACGQTANQYVKPYSENFRIGSNLGYYGNGWDDPKLVAILAKAGGGSLRPTLPEHFVEKWGYDIRLSAFRSYANDHNMKELTCFIEGPSDAHRDKTVYEGNTQSSKLFANLYEPIWKADGTVNPENYYAIYVYKLTQTYGDYIRFWEVLNEPDLGHSRPADWLTRAPLPSESKTTLAPFYHYVRMLRITWEVVKKYQPDDYVTTGGIGHKEYLDALLRYTDNPNGGTVTSQYPNKGGAYFDVLSFHLYPQHSLQVWDNSIGGFRYNRTSDYAAARVMDHKEAMETTLSKYGYNGSTYPKKHFIVTETNVARRTIDEHISSDEMQRNYGIKTVVLAQKNHIKQLYFFTLGEGVDAPAEGVSVPSSSRYGLMGFYENLKRDSPGNEKLTDFGKALKTTKLLLDGYRYDASRTAALNLPDEAEGAAFSKNGDYVYVLWAKALEDTRETASVTYSFPSAWNFSSVERHEWNHASTNSSTKLSPKGITLSGSPAFFIAEISDTDTPPQAQTISFPSIPTKTYGDPDFIVKATASSGLAVSFRIATGPAKITGSTVTLTGTGTVTVEATQSGDDTYEAAEPVRQSFTVNSHPTTDPDGCTATGTILREQWSGVSGTLLSSIPLHTAPTATGQLPLFEAPSGMGSNYGARVRGYICAPATGSYTFFIAGDDNAELWLSSDDSPANKTRIAHLSGWTNPRQWDKYSSQRSAKVTLEAGKRYYIEALHKQGWGGDNLAVAWQLPNGQTEAPINGSRLSPYETELNLGSISASESITMANAFSKEVSLTAYPNPFTTLTTLQFTLQRSENVSLEVYDVQGRLIRQLYAGEVEAMKLQRIVFKADGLEKGIYLVRLVSGSNVITQKVVLDK